MEFMPESNDYTNIFGLEPTPEEMQVTKDSKDDFINLLL